MDTRNAASDTIETAKDIGRGAMDKGYESAHEYVSKGMDYAGDLSAGLTDFVQRQPWLAVAGAFLVGYVVAKTLKRISL
jgi:hypothetical protein